MRDSGKGSQEEAEPEAGRQSAGGKALRGQRWVGSALPALIGRAEDF